MLRTTFVCAMSFVFFSALPADSAILFGPVCGAATDTSAVVVYKLDKSKVTCRLVLSESPELTDSTLSVAVETVAERGNVVKLPLTGLKPETDYHYGLELNGVLQSTGRGRFTSFPSQPDSFTFAFGNSNKYSSSASGLAAALENEISFFLCTGDFFYENIAVNKINRFRAAYQKAFKNPAAEKMGKTVPFAYVWDDHDYGPGNSDRTAAGRTASRRAYRENIPHYPLAAGDGDAPIHQAFSFGKVRFILTDLRSARDRSAKKDDAAKSMMGASQLKWFLSELKNSSLTHDLVFWVSSVPYTSPQKAGGDDWGGYSTERAVIADFVKDNGIDNFMIIAGDAHSLAAGDGRDGDYATGGGAPLAEIIAAPLDNTATSIKGGPWSQGAYRAADNTNSYGLVTVKTGDTTITVAFSGNSNNHEKRIELQKTFAKKPAVTVVRKVRKEERFAVMVRSLGNGMVKITGRETSLSPMRLRIYDIRGKLVKAVLTRSVFSEGVMLSLAPGFYTLQLVRTDNVPKETVNFIVE